MFSELILFIYEPALDLIRMQHSPKDQESTKHCIWANAVAFVLFL